MICRKLISETSGTECGIGRTCEFPLPYNVALSREAMIHRKHCMELLVLSLRWKQPFNKNSGKINCVKSLPHVDFQILIIDVSREAPIDEDAQRERERDAN